MIHETELNRFSNQVRAIPDGEPLDMCYSCGTCTSKCMIQQKLDPEYNPRRLLHMVMLDMREEAYNHPTIWLCSECDICYPACPQKIHISGVLMAVRSLAVQDGKRSLIEPAQVDEQTCVACGLCVAVCPYDAIELVNKKIPYRGLINVAQVNSAKCMACGLCGAVCRSTSIGIHAEFSNDKVVGDLWKWLNPLPEVTI